MPRCRLILIFIFFNTPPLAIPEVYFSAQVIEVCFFISQFGVAPAVSNMPAVQILPERSAQALELPTTAPVVVRSAGRGYTATLTPSTPPVNIVIRVPANVAQDSAGNGNLEASQTVNYSGGEPSAAARIAGRLTFDRVPFARSGSGLNAGSTGHRSHEDCPGGGLDYGNIRREPIRDVWVEAVNASGTVTGRTRSDANGRYNLSVAANTPVRIRVSAHMQRTEAGGPRWDVKVTDNTQGNALYVLQGDLASSGTGASTRNLNAASGWVVPQGGSAGRYINT